MKKLVKALGRKLVKYLTPSAPTDLPYQRWNLTREDGELNLHGHRLSELASQYGSPIHIVDLEKLRQQYQRFAVKDQLGQLEVFYSYKTNPLPRMLHELHHLGGGAEVISAFEFWLARKLGVPGSRIIYNGPGKSQESIEQAIADDILLYNFNHPEEIKLVQAMLQSHRKRLRVGLRVSMSNSWAGQLGMSQREGIESYRLLLSQKEFEVSGLHSHRGHLIRTKLELSNYVDEVLQFVETLHRELTWLPKILDLGGSLASPTIRSFQANEMRLALSLHREPAAPVPVECLSIEAYRRQILEQVQAFFSSRNWPCPRIIVEPGRSLSAEVQMLVTQVLTTRKSDEINYLVVDGGTAVCDPIKSEFHQLFKLKVGDKLSPQKYRIVGPICHMGDVLYPVKLLPETQAGEYLAIMDSGAYFLAEDRSFSFPRPAVIAVDSGGLVQVWRRLQEFDDIVQRDFFL